MECVWKRRMKIDRQKIVDTTIDAQQEGTNEICSMEFRRRRKYIQSVKSITK